MPPKEDLFSLHQNLIRDAVVFICRRKGLNEDDASDFASHVNLKLLDNDQAILRKFRGISSMNTYLATVVHRLYQDYRIGQWGKWRPSARARRLGSAAETLERLIYRENYSTDQAIEILKTNHHIDLSYEALSDLARQLPQRMPRQMVSEAHLRSMESNSAGADAMLISQETAAQKSTLEHLLNEAMASLNPEDQLVLKMHYQDNFTIAQIARILKRDQGKLYRRLRKNFKRLKQILVRKGVRKQELGNLFNSDTQTGD